MITVATATLLPINKAACLTDRFNAGCKLRAHLRDAHAAFWNNGVDDGRNPGGADPSKLSLSTRGTVAHPPRGAHEVRSHAPGRSPTPCSASRRSMVRWRRPYLRTVGHCAALAAHKFTESAFESVSRATLWLRLDACSGFARSSSAKPLRAVELFLTACVPLLWESCSHASVLQAAS